MKSIPLVSICCITYNHAPFIRKCLEGFLMQKTCFPIEILIHDDASTDGTSEIIKEYAKRFSSIVFPLFEEENKYSNGYHGRIDLFNYNRSRGKYIAYCEGDDYWTDPYKLQKQVDFMEEHPECSVTFHNFDTWFYNENRWERNVCRLDFGEEDESFKLSLSVFFKKWVTQPCTMVFRAKYLPNGRDLPYQYYRDQHEIFHLLMAGDGYVLNFNGAVRCKHPGGVHSGMDSEIEESTLAVSIAQELYRFNKLNEVRDYLLGNLDWAISIRRGLKQSRTERLKFIIERFKVSHSFKGLIKQLIHCCPESYLP